MSRADWKTRVQRARARGDLDAARRILQGAAGGSDPERTIAYGASLLEHGDVLEAGRFLLVGGSTAIEHQAAVELFLAHHRRTDWRSLRGRLPGAWRSAGPSEVVPQLREALGPEFAALKPRVAATVGPVRRIAPVILASCVLLFMVATGAAFFLGLYSIGEWAYLRWLT